MERVFPKIHQYLITAIRSKFNGNATLKIPDNRRKKTFDESLVLFLI